MAHQIADAIRSYSAHKGHFTRAVNGANVLFELLGTGFANDSYVSLVEPLEKAEKQLARCGTFVDLLAQLKYEQIKDYKEEFAANHEMWLKLDADAKKLLHNAVKNQPAHAVQPLDKEVA